MIAFKAFHPASKNWLVLPQRCFFCPHGETRIPLANAICEAERLEAHWQQQLEALGDLAEPALRKALRGQPSLELRRRVQRLLEKLDGTITDSERLRVLRALEVLEQIGTPEARQALQSLAEGAPGVRLTREAKASLERLAKRSTANP